MYFLKNNNESTKQMCSIDVTLVSLLLFFKYILTFFWCFHCWYWTSKCWLVGMSLSSIWLLINPLCYLSYFSNIAFTKSKIWNIRACATLLQWKRIYRFTDRQSVGNLNVGYSLINGAYRWHNEGDHMTFAGHTTLYLKCPPWKRYGISVWTDINFEKKL